jgi:type IV fimbrial biogenesis protein FimT
MDFQTYSLSRAYTLAELMTTLAIGSIILSIAIPGYQWLAARTAVTSAVNLFLTHLHQARSEAVTREQVVVLCPSNDGLACEADYRAWADGYIVFADLDRNRQRSEAEPVISYSQAESSRVSIYTSSKSRSVLAYLPTGRAWVSNTTVRFCVKGRSQSNRAVIISPTGRPRLSKTLANGGSIICAEK